MIQISNLNKLELNDNITANSFYYFWHLLFHSFVFNFNTIWYKRFPVMNCNCCCLSAEVGQHRDEGWMWSRISSIIKCNCWSWELVCNNWCNTNPDYVQGRNSIFLTCSVLVLLGLTLDWCLPNRIDILPPIEDLYDFSIFTTNFAIIFVCTRVWSFSLGTISK